MNRWITHLQEHKGSGKTFRELRVDYRRKYPECCGRSSRQVVSKKTPVNSVKTVTKDPEYCKPDANTKLALQPKNDKNAYAKFVKVPAWNVVSPGNACMLASIGNLLHQIPQIHKHIHDTKGLPNPIFPAMYLQRQCNPGKGMQTFLELLEKTLDFASHRVLWPVMDGKKVDFTWLQSVKFKLVEGQKAMHVIEAFTRGKKKPFLFYDKDHAYCAVGHDLLTIEGRNDHENVYALNGSNIGATTSKKSLEFFRRSIQRNPSYEIVYIDDYDAPRNVKGDFISNEYPNGLVNVYA